LKRFVVFTLIDCAGDLWNDGYGMKILAVDDDPFILELLPMVAARAGFKDVSTATSGELALQMLRDSGSAFECLLFDISMPNMDGIELCSLTRAVPGYAKTPIIMVTAMTEKAFVDRAFAAGATDYVNKPFDVVELGARLGMAEELVATRRVAEAAMRRETQPSNDSARFQTVQLAQEVEIDGVTSLIEYSTLRNYLSQLSVSGISDSQVMVFKISQVAKIHARTTGDLFLQALTKTASAIYEVMQRFKPKMAYIGNGMFLMVLEKPNLENSQEFEVDIQAILDRQDLTYDNGEPLRIGILVSNPIRPSTSKLQRVRKTFDRAILRAERLEPRK
jgi:DNA-binding response OmpR family regulator